MALDVTMRAVGGNVSFGEMQDLQHGLNAEGVLPQGMRVGRISRHLDGYQFSLEIREFDGPNEEAAARLAGALDRLDLVGGRGIRMFLERSEFVPDVATLGREPIGRAPSDTQPA